MVPALLAPIAALLASVPGSASPFPAVEPEALIRMVVKRQRRAEAAFEGTTYDLREVRTTYGKDGRARDVETRLFYVLAGERGSEGSRELVEVNGRPATDDERRKAAEEDEKGRKKRYERRAADRAARPPAVSGDDDDPLVGTRRLSDLLGLFTFRVTGEEVVDGRLGYVLEFAPRKDQASNGLGERALGSLEGRALIDASDFQIRSIEARLARPVKVAGGLAANVKQAEVQYEGAIQARDVWFPCRVDVRLQGKTALFFRLDSGLRVEIGNLRSFEVDTQTSVSPEPPSEPPVPHP